MKRYFSLLLMLLMTASFVGCGAPETDEAASAEAEELESSPDYEQQMMGGGEAATE